MHDLSLKTTIQTSRSTFSILDWFSIFIVTKQTLWSRLPISAAALPQKVEFLWHESVWIDLPQINWHVVIWIVHLCLLILPCMCVRYLLIVVYFVLYFISLLLSLLLVMFSQPRFLQLVLPGANSQKLF